MSVKRWSYSSYLSSDDYNLFYTAASTNPHAYHPLAISKLDGLRYRYICNTLKSSNTNTELAIVELYKPREGNPYITRVYSIDTEI
ncbi:MAG: hypothetical protein GX359_06205 [Clostridiales bacterium]|nr:hypothetical protein [Clostridiales bacterium]